MLILDMLALMPDVKEVYKAAPFNALTAPLNTDQYIWAT